MTTRTCWVFGGNVQLFGRRSANIPGGLTMIATQDGFRACPPQLWECKGSKPGGSSGGWWSDGTHCNQHTSTRYDVCWKIPLPSSQTRKQICKKNSPIHTKPQADPYPWVGHGVPNIPDKLCNIEKVLKTMQWFFSTENMKTVRHTFQILPVISPGK